MFVQFNNEPPQQVEVKGTEVPIAQVTLCSLCKSAQSDFVHKCTKLPVIERGNFVQRRPSAATLGWSLSNNPKE